MYARSRLIQGRVLLIFGFRRLPPGSASGRPRPVCLAATSLRILMMWGERTWKLNTPWQIIGLKSTDPKAVSPNFLLPSSSVCFCQLPPGCASGRIRPVCLMATSHRILMMSGEPICKLNRPWAKFKPGIDRFKGWLSQFSASAGFRRGPLQVISDLSGSWRRPSEC